MATAAPGGARPAAQEQRRRRHQLRDLRAGPAVPRLRRPRPQGRHRPGAASQGRREARPAQRGDRRAERRRPRHRHAGRGWRAERRHRSGRRHGRSARQRQARHHNGRARGVSLSAPVTGRRSAKRHKLVTDARTRFERGVDPNLQPLASARAAYLIAEVSGGTVHAGITSTGHDVTRPTVAFRPSRVGFLMGFDVVREVQKTYLERLGCVVDEEGADDWRVTPPSWRYDISIEEDLVEEVARVHGYEHIGSSVPGMRFVPPATDPTHRMLRQRLAAIGFQETITYVFTGDADLARSRAPQAVSRIENPQGADRAVLRTSLLTGLLGAEVANRGEEALALFEVGRVFLEREEERLGLLMRGPSALGAWRDDQPGDFYSFKGRLEELAALSGATLELAPHRHDQLHPGVSANVRWQGEVVGLAGRLHPEIEAAYELPATYYAEVALPLGERRVRF